MRRQADTVFELRMEMTGAQAGHLGQLGHTDAPRQMLEDVAIDQLQIQRTKAARMGLTEQTQVQGTEQNTAQCASQQRIRAVTFKLGTGIAQQILKISIQLWVARHLEQASEQLQVVAAATLLIQINDQHTVITHAGELVISVSRHKTGTHTAYLATTAIDLKLSAPSQRKHQLVMVVGVFMGLIIET
jgi:hypothetical protein